MEQYVNNSECIKLDIDEVDYYSLGPEYSDVDVKRILEHKVASKMRWDDCQRQRKPQGQEREEEDKRKWFAAYEDTAKKMLKYLEDSEDSKVSFRKLKEQLESVEEAGISIMQIAKQARNERGQKLFQIFRREENEVSMSKRKGKNENVAKVGRVENDTTWVWRSRHPFFWVVLVFHGV